ncbi:hypothetical protein [Halovenus sp. HT40]|uniref:hypothetical protein n=1 Tax=Halovenus sp. HT40 TaxID=3126691 RepID=UPI00300EC734
MNMQDIDHTHPNTGTAFGQNYYDSGTVATDGGRDEDEETMEDVDHEPPSEGATRSFERGTEGRERSV